MAGEAAWRGLFGDHPAVTIARMLRFEPVTTATWPAMETLFEGRGGAKHCWCMAWRARGGAREPVGVLAFDGGEPVAWIAVAPRAVFRDLGGRPGADDRTWSIVCFFIRRDRRGTGLFPKLVAAAVKAARQRGARAVEAYPVDPDKPAYRHAGFGSSFEEAGFAAVGPTGARRHVIWREERGKVGAS